LVPGAPFSARIQLNDIGRRIAAGSRLRLAIATQHWPILWPQPDLGTLTLETGSARLDLPVRPRRADETEVHFLPPEMAPDIASVTERPGTSTRHVTADVGAGLQTIALFTDYGRTRLTETGIIADSWCRESFRIVPHDPLSARLDSAWFIGFESAGVAVEIDATVSLTADRQDFHLAWSLEVRQAGAVVHARSEQHSIKRDFM
jgi:hypothetical protein